MHDQEAAVHQTFHLERSSSFGTDDKDSCNASMPIVCTQLHQPQTDSCPLEVKPHPMKMLYLYTLIVLPLFFYL